MDPELKGILRGLSLKLRHLLEGYYDEEGRWHPGDLERRLNELGVWRERTPKPVDELPHLSEEDLNARKVVDAYLQYRKEAGVSLEEAVAEFVRESAYTWANRLLALRCMEARGLIDEVILQKEIYGWRSLQHNRLASKRPELCTGKDEGLFLVVFQEFELRSKELPQLFDPGVPAVALRPSVAALKKCVALLSGREPVSSNEFACDAVFEAPDAFGWAYQYWNEEEKNRVFEKVRTAKAKVEGADIIPATCIYTEPYMVRFLVQNSLGALWMSMHPESKLADKWEYYVKDVDRAPVDRKPVSKIAFMDPACGSGHFLLEAFEVLYDMYKEEGTFSTTEEICVSILDNNLFGIDIDERAVQISIAVLWMKAKIKAPLLDTTVLSNFPDHLLATNIRLPKDRDHLDNFLGKHPEDRPLRRALEAVFEGLENVHELGSLLQIEEPVEKELQYVGSKLGTQRTLFGPQTEKEWESWRRGVVERLKEHIAPEAISADLSEFFFSHSAGKGLMLFDLLARRYDVVATNPPYIGFRTMGSALKKYVYRHYAPGKRDLYTAFILRCQELARKKGHIAMVTQHSWMFLSSFAKLRALEEEELRGVGPGVFKGLLRETTLETLAHLGPGAFGEISGEVVNSVLFVLANVAPSPEHHLTAFRLIGPKSSADKDASLLASVKIPSNKNRFFTPQHGLLDIPTAPLVYSASENILRILNSPVRLNSVALARQGLATSDNNRFLRTFWEVPAGESDDWPSYLKGGRYQKWAGLDWLAIDWRHNGAAVKAKAGDLYGSVTRTIKNQDFYFRPCLTYTLMSRGSLGVRKARPGPFDVGGMCIFSDSVPLGALAALLNSRIVSYLLRIVSQDLKFQCGTVELLPLPIDMKLDPMWESLGNAAIELKDWAVARMELIERGSELYRTYLSRQLWNDDLQAVLAILHSIEALCDQKSAHFYALNSEDETNILGEVGIPPGQMPLIKGYDMLPTLPSYVTELPREVLEYFARHKRQILSPQEMTRLKRRLRTLYEAGPGVEVEGAEAEDEENAVVGTHIRIPAETFLEELSQRLEVHPISVYWLLKEGIEQEEWHCISEEQRLIADQFTIAILHLLGHRWPKQIEKAEPVPEWSDPDGIVPLTDGTSEPNLLNRIRELITANVENGDVTLTERTFADIIGKPLSKWLMTNFFKHHTKQFKKRPIVWQIESHPVGSSKPRQGHGGALRDASEPAFSCLVYYHKLDADLLPKIRSQYVGPVRIRYETELRTLERVQTPSADQTERRMTLEYLIEELKEFDAKLEKVINEGFDSTSLREIVAEESLDRWTSVDAEASPPPTRDLFYNQEKAYNPDINDGVRVNIAPLQKAGILAADVLSKKDMNRAIRDRTEWRADERRWCREGKLPQPGWWKTKGEAV